MSYTPEQLAMWRRFENVRRCFGAARAARVALALGRRLNRVPAEATGPK
jgi:hypothetical protein